ncbi:MAG TPA: hypothetical protein VF574_15005 [Allosphingosinicella sp.]|jgi:hypothetical protein
MPEPRRAARDVVNDPADDERKLRELVEALRSLRTPGGAEEREPIEFPDRPGLY